MDFAQWKVTGIFKADAQKCADEIKTLKTITPENVLDYARDESSELHKCFEWDDSIAAGKYRLQQARQVIQLIKIVPKNEEKEKPTIRMFQITNQRNVYEPTRLFLKKPDAYTELLERAKKELESLKSRYATLSELEEVFKAIDEL